MNKANFDSLKHIKAPQDWLDKAAAIPETAVQKRSAFPLFRVAMAASVVLVSVIGLLVFLFFGGGSAPVAIRESGDSATAVSDTETEDSQAGQSGTKSGGTEPAETIAVLSTDAQGNTVITYQEKPAATGSGTQPTGSALSPTEPVASTNPRATEKKAPTTPPTEHPPAPTQTPDPTPSPADDPTEAQTPTEIWLSPESVVSFSATFDAALLDEGETVYCIVMKEGYAWASSGKQKADYFITKNGLVYANCDMLIEEDAAEGNITYRYLFLSESGKVLASGTQVV